MKNTKIINEKYKIINEKSKIINEKYKTINENYIETIKNICIDISKRYHVKFETMGFDEDHVQDHSWDQASEAIDSIREKFGKSAIRPGSAL